MLLREGGAKCLFLLSLPEGAEVSLQSEYSETQGRGGGEGIVGLWVVCQLGANWNKCEEKQVARLSSTLSPASRTPTHPPTHPVALCPLRTSF